MNSPTRAGQALIDSFDLIRVINLLHRTDRRKEMSRQFSRLGLKLDNQKASFFEATVFADAGSFPTAGARGCFDSHLGVLKEALKTGAHRVLIIEDDFDFHDKIETVLPPVLERLRQDDWDIFFGSILPGQYRATATPVETLHPSKGVAGCHFYSLRGRVIADAVLYLEAMRERMPGKGHPDGEPMHYDGALSVFRHRHPDVRTLVANPDLGFQRISRTDIHALRFYDRIPVLLPLSTLLRRAIRMTGRTRHMAKKAAE